MIENLGPYRIVDKLGEGGMGEVYRAKDTRLDRTVAIKILSANLAHNPEFQARFAREARTISSLDHPQICALHDVGESNGTSYLVMQYLEGETLAARLLRGALPLDQALRYGCEIAAALDHAHRRGIVHRDLKPGNVMLTKSGARLLDFGLAKPASAMISSQSTRIDSPVTSAGTVIGTVQYMAPEQIESREADALSDIFAFGAVLHEMLTGVRAFSAPTQAGLMGAILRDNPPAPSSLVPGLPPALDHVAQRCLAKDPDERWASAHDLLIELTWIRSGAGGPVTASSARGYWRERAIWVALATVLAAGLASAWFRHAPTPSAETRFLLTPPSHVAWTYWGVPSVSPDGKHVALGATEHGAGTLWIRRMDGVAFRRIDDVSRFNVAEHIAWSADGRWLVFAEGPQLKRAAVSGGTPEVICRLPDPEDFAGATVNADGVVLLGFNNRPLHRVALSGGRPEPIASLNAAQGEVGQAMPFFLPGGKEYLFVSRAKAPSAVVGMLGSSERTALIPDAERPSYVSPGLLLFVRNGRPMALLFDLSNLAVSGEPRVLESQLHAETVTASSNGTLIYRSQIGGNVRRHGEVSSGNTRLAWFDRTGRELEAVTPLGAYVNPRLSPDGSSIAVEKFDNETSGDIWIYDLKRRVGIRRTDDAARDSDPAWSPHGDFIAWANEGAATASLEKPGTPPSIVVQRVDGGGPIRPIHSGLKAGYQGGPFLADWSRDGRYLAIIWVTGSGAGAPAIVSLDGSPTVEWPSSRFSELPPRFSPNSRWVAYVSHETGTPEVYVQPFPPAPGKVRVSSSGGMQPAWRQDQRELYYLSLDRTLMAVPVRTVGNLLDFGPPAPLFKTPVPDPSWGRNHYEPSADGTRFLLTVLDMSQPLLSPDVVVVLNGAQALHDELRR